MNNQSFALFTVVLLLIFVSVTTIGLHKLIHLRGDGNKQAYINTTMQSISNRSIDKASNEIEKSTYSTDQYSPTILPLNSDGMPDITWDNVPIDRTEASIEVKYFIEKQCTNATPTDMTIEKDCFVANKASSGSRKIGGVVYKFYNGVYYKIIVRMKDNQSGKINFSQILVIY